MKKWSILSAAILLSVALTGCTSAYYAASGYAGDDLYVTHDKAEIARRQQREAEVRKAEAEARRAEWEALLAEAQAAAAETNYKRAATGSSSNSYTSVLADSYESAYARRLYGFESLSYRMPSSYWNFRYGDAFTYVSAYDPAFYNIVISGDQVWVEPKYITSMFGSWGATVYTGSWGWNLAWNHTPRWWGYSPWGWNSWGYAYHPWYASWYGPGWGYGWRPGWGGQWAYRPAHNYRLDRYPSRPSNTSYRTSSPAGSRTNGTGGVNSGRRGGYNSSGAGSYNNSGNRSNGSSRPGGNSSYNNSNSNRGNYNYNSGSSGRNTGGYSGSGTRSSGGSGSSSGTRSSGGGRSYTGGR